MQKKILIVGTNMMSIYHHRLELIKALIKEGFKVVVAAPTGGEVENLKKTGCKFIHLDVETRGTNVKKDLKLLKDLRKLYRKERPDVVLTFYTKTNIYGGIVARALKIPYIENITGLGTSLAKEEGNLYKILSTLYRSAVKKSNLVFFQNDSNYKFFKDKKLYNGKYKMLPGSGVSLERYKELPYPDAAPTINFLFLSRILKEKGIEEFITAATALKAKYKNVEFNVAGPYVASCEDIVKKAEKEGIIKYHGKVYDIQGTISGNHCTVLPSYYPEGMANVLLESAASGRPIITTGLPGCVETVDNGVTGFVVKERDADDLAKKMEKIILMDQEDRIKMGKAGRKKMEREFDREIVTKEYLDAIKEIIKE